MITTLGSMQYMQNVLNVLESMTYSCAGLALNHPCAVHRLPELFLPERLTKLVSLKPLTIVITPNVRACLTSSPLEGLSSWTVSLHSPLASMARKTGAFTLLSALLTVVEAKSQALGYLGKLGELVRHLCALPKIAECHHHCRLRARKIINYVPSKMMYHRISLISEQPVD